jgi:hypothetical protein
MLRGYRGYVAATIGTLAFFGVVAGVALKPIELQKYDLPKAPGAEYRPGGSKCEPARLQRLPSRDRTDEAIRCQDATEEYRLKRDDLVQQSRSADAAEAVAILTYRQTILLLVSAVMGLITLGAAIYAAWYAKRAAEAAEKGLDHQTKVTAIDLRPWVTIRLVPLALVQTDKAISIEIDIITENLGRTVAKNAQLKFKLIYATDDVHEQIKGHWEGWAKDRHESRKVIMPGESVPFPYWSHQARSGLPWVGKENRAISPVLVASVYYQTDGGDPDVWHQTDRAFTIGRKTEALIQDYIKENDTKLDAAQMVARPYSANLAT